MTLEIRETLKADNRSVRRTISKAFGGEGGAEITELVAALMIDPTAQPLISLVAVLESDIVGHILFSCARIDGAEQATQAAILAPLSVAPEHQNRGVGGTLVRQGLSAAAQAGCDLVFVLGSPRYYPRHGFVPAGPRGLEAPYPIPAQDADAWMVHRLHPQAIESARGQVTCADSLMDLKYWRR